MGKTVIWTKEAILLDRVMSRIIQLYHRFLKLYQDTSSSKYTIQDHLAHLLMHFL